MALGIH